MAAPVLIELREVRKRFGGRDGVPEVEILHGIDLRIRAGEYVAIVGASGSGKTTLMNILGCLDRPSSGEYLFQGEAVPGLDDDALAALRREVFGFVFQGYHLIGTSSALDNVAMPARYAGVSEQARHERAAALLSRLGLAERLQYLPHQLSGGQQQRVSIARALVNGGRVILADEPTGALDSTSGEQVMQQLDELAAAGHTLILITHDPAVAARARRIISMADGRIVGDVTAPVDGKVHPLPETGRAVADDSLPVRHADAPVQHADAPIHKDGRPCAEVPTEVPTEAPAEVPADAPTEAPADLPPLRGRGREPAPAGHPAQDLPVLRGRGRLPLLADLPEILRSAWRVMRLNRLRTGLTLLGIIIGVASVIVMLAVGQGSQEKVLAEMQTFGLRTIYIFREWLSDTQQARALSMADVAAVQQVPNVEQASPVIDQNGIIVRHGNRTLRTNLSATTRHFAQALNWPVSQGTLLETEDEHDLRKVVLLGERVRQALFGAHGQAVGQEILVGNVPFRVIGVMAPKPAPFPEDDVNNQVIVPVGAAAVRLVGSMELSRINVVIRDMRHAAETEAAIVKTLTARHGRKDFSILNQAQAVQQLAQANRTLTLMLGLIAAISLLVGGIGVMNVMLMTVRERTREIGIRIATGARQADILRQFLVEAMLLTGIGGTVGVSGGLLIGLGLKALGIPMAFSPLAAAMAFGCAVATGMIFGFMPARQAARLDPVRALAGE
ncbi:ABC transporter permease [Lautropia mirabilis]|uniref:ABC transporter permease n=1 Tax=Lautropia mirabilis TaxID=47671 RepID=UPI0028D20993|nr:ABC transporter permease [Lautropia mirabilis]